MASRSPPLHASQKRRTSSRGVSLISSTLLARSARPLPDHGLLLCHLLLLRRLGRLLPRRRRLLPLGRRRPLLLGGRRLLLGGYRPLPGRLLDRRLLLRRGLLGPS